MLNWLRSRRLSPVARKKLMLVTARAEEALVETHVSNILDLLATLGDEIEPDRAIELYLERIHVDEGLAGSVTTRLLARLESAPDRRARQQRFRDVFREGRRR